MAHYQILRGSGFSPGASIAGTFVTSAIWEYLAEFKELISLNDLVVNTVSGVAIGEPFYQLGEMLLRSAPSPLTRGLAALLSPVATFNDWLDGRRRGQPGSPIGGGQGWHRFDFTAGLARAQLRSAAAGRARPRPSRRGRDPCRAIGVRDACAP